MEDIIIKFNVGVYEDDKFRDKPTPKEIKGILKSSRNGNTSDEDTTNMEIIKCSRESFIAELYKHKT